MANHEATTKLFEHVQAADKVNTYEKTGFLQNFYLGDKDLAEETTDGSVTIDELNGSNSSSFSPSGSGCLCKLMLNFSQLPIPFNGLSSGTLNSTDWGVQDWRTINSMNVLQFGTSGGANKYAQFQTNGKRLSGRDIQFNATELGGTQTAASLDYSLVCAFGENPGVDCGCAKNVDIMFEFDAHLRTEAGLTQCFLCGSRESHALIEEVVALSVLNHRNKLASQVITAKRAEAKSAVDRTVNANFWISATELAAEIGKLFVPNAPDINAASIDKIKTALQGLIQQPLNTGGGTTSVFRANMLSGRHFFKLLPNQPVTVSLTSLTKANLGGATAWQNIAESNTDFALAGIVTLENVNDKFDKDCCTPKVANWALGGFFGSNVNQSNLRQKVGVFLNTFAPWDGATNDPNTNAINIRTDLGFLEKAACASQFYDDGSGPSLKGTSPWLVVPKENLMVIQNEQNRQPFTFSVCDALGRVVASGKSDSNAFSTSFELPNNALSGVYLVRIEQGVNIYTSKFTKMK